METWVSVLFKDGKTVSAHAVFMFMHGLIYAQIFL